MNENPICKFTVSEINETFQLRQYDDGSLTLYRKYKSGLKQVGHYSNPTKAKYKNEFLNKYAIAWVLIYGETPKGRVYLKKPSFKVEHLCCDAPTKALAFTNFEIQD